MVRIRQDVIDRVRQTADILDVVSQYVDLKRRGRNYFGLCPFHREKTPSFSVAPDKEIFHCFGCGAGGNVFSFLMDYEKISFVEAVKKLADRYGIPLELEAGGGKKEFFGALYELHRVAAELYHETLFSDRGKEAREYLLGRGFAEATLKQFMVGFAPESWDFLYQAIKDRKYPLEVQEKSGLFSKTERGFVDRFRSRIMFPIFDTTGKVIAFGGRVFGVEDAAKYLNSPETPIYYKRDVFYGLHVSREAIRSQQAALLVEGYLDFLQLYQAGLHHVVAASGTALTDRHAAQLRKATSRVYLVYDGDEAGVKATLRAGYTFLRGGVEPLVVPVPTGLDPDDWVRKKGVKPLKKAIDQALPLLTFHLQTVDVDGLSATERSRFVGEILREIATITDGIVRDDLLRSLAEALHLEEVDILKRFQRVIRRRRSFPDEPVPEETTPLLFTSLEQKAQVEIIRVLVAYYPQVESYVREHLDVELFTEPLLKKVVSALLDQGSNLDLATVVDRFESKVEREAVSKILFDELETEDPHQVLQECLATIKSRPLKEKIKAARVKIRELEATGQDSTELVLEVARLQKELHALGH